MQLTVKRMSCGGCVKTITTAIQSIDNHAKVEADLATKIVRVETSASRDDVMRALAAAGYPATQD